MIPKEKEIKEQQMDYIANQINKLAGLNIFNNTRKREYIEARSLFCLICYRYLKLTYEKIAIYLINKGKSSDHATVLHALKSYDIYSKYNADLDIWLSEVLNCMDNLDRHKKLQLAYHKMKQLNNDNLEVLSEHLDILYKDEIEQKQINEYINETSES